MNDLYTPQYLELTAKVIRDDIKDLRMWSAHNEDKYFDVIQDLKLGIENLLGLIEDDKKNNELLEQGLHNDFTP